MNEAATDLLGHTVTLGSHGAITLIDVMGDDNRVVDAARISYGVLESERDFPKDRNLLRYMMRHGHTSPFEQCEMVFRVKVPMDTWRQWIRHRTASVNEYSTRYTDAIDEMLVTPPDAWRLQDQGNRQGSSPDTLTKEDGDRLTAIEKAFHARARHIYKTRLDLGVAREQARKDLPLSTYTLAYWKIDVHNLMSFLRLRMDSHAQLEIREYAQANYENFFVEAFPVIAEAFKDYVLDAVTFSGPELKLLRISIKGLESLTAEDMTTREKEELIAKVKRITDG